MCEEIWKPVVEHNGYEVSNFGRVRSVDRVVMCAHPAQGTVAKNYRGKLLRPGGRASGHVTVAIGKNNSKSVHTLVLESFVGPCPEGREGCHSDDDPTNNQLSNLRWDTRSNNLYDAVRNGKKPVGEAVVNAKLTEAAVRIIRQQKNPSVWFLGQRFGVSSAAIQQVLDGVTWKCVV